MNNYHNLIHDSDIILEFEMLGKVLNYEDIKNLNEKAICQVKSIGKSGTGFFCDFKNFVDNDKSLIVFLTCCHVFNPKENNINILYLYIQNKQFELDLGKKRKIWSSKKLDYTCIEILEDDNIMKYFNLDENLIYNDFDNQLEKIRIYSFGYLGSSPNIELKYDVGNITFFNKYFFFIILIL